LIALNPWLALQENMQTLIVAVETMERMNAVANVANILSDEEMCERMAGERILPALGPSPLIAPAGCR
jgi:hypothetical protein